MAQPSLAYIGEEEDQGDDEMDGAEMMGDVAGFYYRSAIEEPHRIQKINKEKSHSLEYLLENRASAEQLLQQNIMHGKMGIAPAIQQTQRALRFQKTLDTLDQKLERRPNKETLMTSNIIRSKSADSLQARQLALRFKRTVERMDHKLETRLTPHQLQDQNIIKIGIAPSVYATQKQLQFTVAAESLDHKLENRPTRASLVASNIVKGSGGVAPSIMAAQQELKFHTTADALDHKLEYRPSKSSLMTQNILRERGHAFIQGTQQTLKFNKTKSQVGHKMVFRPSKGNLVDQHILIDEPPFLSEQKKKIIRRRVTSSLATHLENRPSREEFDVRFRYYFTDSDIGSCGSSDTTSQIDTGELSAMDIAWEAARARADAHANSFAHGKSHPHGNLNFPRAHSLNECAIRQEELESLDENYHGGDENEDEEEEDEEVPEEGEGGEGGEGKGIEIPGARKKRLSRIIEEPRIFEDYYAEEGYAEYYKSGDDDTMFLASSV